MTQNIKNDRATATVQDPPGAEVAEDKNDKCGALEEVNSADSSCSDDDSAQDEDDGTDAITDYFEALATKWAVDPSKHGTNMVKITAKSQTFSVHRRLLRDASPYFKRLLTHPRQDKDSHIDLSDVSDHIFGIFYRFLYGGDIWNEGQDLPVGPELESEQTMWLRVLKTAKALQVRDLADGIYTFLTQRLLNHQKDIVLTDDFIEELYTPDQPQHQLRTYVATLASYHILTRKLKSALYLRRLLNETPDFARDVMIELTRYANGSCSCFVEHPSKSPRFLISQLQFDELDSTCLVHKAVMHKESKKDFHRQARIDMQPTVEDVDESDARSLSPGPIAKARSERYGLEARLASLVCVAE